MANVAISGDTSGAVTLFAPAVSGTTTLTLPTTSGTIITTGTPQSGSVLQVVSTNKTDIFTTTSTSYVDITGLSVTITPKFSTSKILVMFTTTIGCDLATVFVPLRLVRNSTAIDIGDAAGSRVQATGGSGRINDVSDTYSINGQYLDSPATTSATVYKVQAANSNGNNTYINSNGLNANNAQTGRYASTITVMEIAA
jgi:hypothetical protein